MNNSHTRALVLAGAGAAGNAWQLGLIAGLADRGVDLTTADVIIGTSAGSTVAAQITAGIPPAALYAAILSEAVPPGRTGRASLSGPDYMKWSDDLIAASSDAADMRRRVGAAALELAESDPRPNRWREVVAARLSRHDWPEQRVLIPAVDARSGIRWSSTATAASTWWMPWPPAPRP